MAFTFKDILKGDTLGEMVKFDFGIYLLQGRCELLEKLTKLLCIPGLCQVCKDLPHKGGIFQSTTFWICQ